jgi:hypothetical protein
VAPPLPELTAQAQTLTSAGDLRGARAVLDSALDPRDTDPQQATPDLATAAALHARILIALGDPHAARMWAGFAHAAEERLHGPHDERTMAAAATHAAVLARIGNHGRAAQLYHDLVRELIARDGPDSPRVLAAEADLATAEHSAGHCTAARDRLGNAWARHRHLYGDAPPAGIKMLARLGAMERECGRVTESRDHLALAEELCARYLPADHPLAAQVTGLARVPASGRHICGRVRQSEGPGGPPPGVHPVPAPGVVPVPRTTFTEQAPQPPAPPPQPPAARPPQPEPGPQTWSEASPPIPPGAQSALSTEGDRGAAEGGPEAGSRAGQPLPELPPDNRITDPKGTLYQQPMYLSEVHQAPGDLTGRHARADTPLPMPGQRVPEYTADGRRVPIGTAPVSPSGEPVTDDRRLPVLVPREDQQSSRKPFVLAAVLVAGIGVAAAVVALTLPRGDGDAPAPASPAAPPSVASAPASSTPAAGAPAGLALRDNRDSVTLSWTYPKGSEGPVLISGGRQGQERRAFQQLPAGSADYIVYGLNEKLNYCFAVAVVHSTDDVATSAPICTARG